MKFNKDSIFISFDEFEPAVCKKCGKVMRNVPKSHADYCYDCEDKE